MKIGRATTRRSALASDYARRQLLRALRMAGSHIDLRKRNAAFQAKIGKTNSLKTVDPVERKPVPKWIIYTFLFLIVGGFGLELLQQIFNYLTAKR
ncbi:hypothetical protein RHOSPDRAFT_34386 [Rhodotorula sp. JG-1b]|nr:hypothetical protein RHOSPDRAFT_34386 [Rhodotorula sp. JG-1b]